MKTIEVFYLKEKIKGNYTYLSAAVVAARCWGGLAFSEMNIIEIKSYFKNKTSN